VSRTSAEAVSIQATWPELIGPPVTAGGSGLIISATTLTAARSKNGNPRNVRTRPAVGSASRVMCQSSASSSNDVSFSGANAIGLIHGNHEHPAVADLAGTRRLDDGADRVVDDAVLHVHLDFHLGQQADVVLLAAVDGRVPFLLAMTPDFSDGHAGDAELGQRLLHVVDLVRSNDGLNQLHRCSPTCA